MIYKYTLIKRHLVVADEMTLAAKIFGLINQGQGDATEIDKS